MMPTEIIFDHSSVPFTSLDLCAIIEVCAQHNVSRLKCRGLDLEFGRTASSEPGQGSFHDSLAPVAAITDIEHEQSSRDSLENDELAMRDEQVALAVIEDPALAEQLFIDGELEDADSDGEDGYDKFE
jgi:hypothetical protein